MAYAATSDVKDSLGIPACDNTDDTLIGDFIAAAQALIETECRRIFEASAGTCDDDYSTRHFSMYEDVDEDGWLMLDKDLAVLRTIDTGDGDEYDSTDGVWLTDPRDSTPIHAIKLREDSNLYWTYTTEPDDDIAIEGKWAYSVTPPVDIKHATMRLAAWLYRQKDIGADVDRPVITPDGSVILPSKMPADVANTCFKYKRTKIGSV
jgi:hypothetical protein